MPFFDQYPYTNFHNVNLDWVLERVKEWGELVEQNNTAFHELEEANESFKRYVENYLADLNIQAQIDDKLDRMFESGELTDYLQPYISSTVTTWLEENITEPTGVVIDSSLTVAGACADAYETGKGINETAFTEEAKNALLNCLMNVLYDTPQYRFFFDTLEKALFKYSIYNNYNWSISNKTLFAVHAAGTMIVNNGNPWLNIPTVDYNNAKQRSIVSFRGIKPYVNYTGNFPLPYYPIPIPEGATGYTLSGNFNSFYFGVEGRIYDSINNIYAPLPSDTNIGNSFTLASISKTFNYLPKNTYILIRMYANSGGTADFENNQPENVILTFTRS